MVHLLLAVIYLAFISLGLPDTILGAAWPIMYREFEVPLSYAGVIFMIISAGTITSSLLSDRLTRRLGAGRVTAISVAVTAAALLGFSRSGAFWMLCLWAIPYGLGAGSVDAALNNYVALHYSSRHMSWLHCMWGIGATVGPYVMGRVLTGGGSWSLGYRAIGIFQVFLAAAMLLSLPLWRRQTKPEAGETGGGKPLSLGSVLKIPGAKEIAGAFFCYSALEQTVILWAGSYLALYKGVPGETAASLSGMFLVGITVGRALNGFLSMRFDDVRLIRMGQAVTGVGVLILLLPLDGALPLAGLILLGLGCAPIYPCVIHSTPAHFGAEHSQALIGIQMACAYAGALLMPPLFGLIANHITVALLPVYLLAALGLMVFLHERMVRKCGV